MEQWTRNQHFSKIHLWPCQELLQEMYAEAHVRKCKARGGEEMGLSAGISVDSVFSGDWFSKAWDMTVWPPNMVQTWWSTLFETNKDVKIDGKKATCSFVFWKGPDKCSNIYVSLHMWVLHRKPKSYVRGFLWFYILQHVVQDLR